MLAAELDFKSLLLLLYVHRLKFTISHIHRKYKMYVYTLNYNYYHGADISINDLLCTFMYAKIYTGQYISAGLDYTDIYTDIVSIRIAKQKSNVICSKCLTIHLVLNVFNDFCFHIHFVLIIKVFGLFMRAIDIWI